jgi:hypothetical protein
MNLTFTPSSLFSFTFMSSATTTSFFSSFAVFFVFVFFLGPVPAQLCYQDWTSVIKRILRHVRKPELSMPLPFLPGLAYKEPLARFPTGTQSELRVPEGRGSMRTCVVSVSWSCAGCAEGSAVASWKSNGYHVKRAGIPDSATLEGEARTSCFRMGRGKRGVFRVRRRGTQGDADESRRHLWEVADSITGRKHRRGVGADTPVMGLVRIGVGPTTHTSMSRLVLSRSWLLFRAGPYERTDHDQLLVRTRSRWRSPLCRTGARFPRTGRKSGVMV